MAPFLTNNLLFFFLCVFEKIEAVANGVNFEHSHTAFIHYTPLDVFDYSLDPVTDNQIESRALLKAFTFAAAKAQSLYGVSIMHNIQFIIRKY